MFEKGLIRLIVGALCLYGLGGCVVVTPTTYAPQARPSAPPPQPVAQNVPDPQDATTPKMLADFHEDLDSKGHWTDAGDAGRCWVPDNVAPDFQPYTAGQWASTDQGMAFQSDEPFAKDTYHYGNWFQNESTNTWMWAPGGVWASSWVTWRTDNTYVGWAPTPPPRVVHVTSVFAAYPRTTNYVFVEKQYVTQPAAYRHAIPRSSNATIASRAQIIPNQASYDRGRVVASSRVVHQLEQTTGKQFDRRTVATPAPVVVNTKAQVRTAGPVTSAPQPPGHTQPLPTPTPQPAGHTQPLSTSTPQPAGHTLPPPPPGSKPKDTSSSKDHKTTTTGN